MNYIKISRSAFQAKIDSAYRFAGKIQNKIFEQFDESKPYQTEVVQTVRLTLSETTLEVSANDLASGISLTMPVESQEEFSCEVPVKLLQETVAKSDDETISIGVNEKHFVVKSSVGKTSLKLATDTNVTTPAQIATFLTGITGQELSHALSMVAFSAERKVTSNEALMGVCLELEDANMMVLAATDGYRLAKYVARLDWTQIGREEYEKKIIIPLKTVTNLIATLSKVTTPVSLGMDENRVAIKWEDGYVSSSLIKANYPDWRRIIPQTTKTQVTFLEGFQNAIKAAKIIARGRDDGPTITLDIDSERTLVKSSSDIGNSTIQLTPQTNSEKNLVVSFNGEFLPDHIAGAITVDLNEFNTPALFSTQTEPGWSFLLMPVILK